MALQSTDQRRSGPVPLEPFHFAFPVHDLAAAREFYGGVLGLSEGRSAETWIDFDLFGHQIVAHLDPSMSAAAQHQHSNNVDGKNVPVPHFGVVIAWEKWEEFVRRLESRGIQFVLKPHIRFAGQPGEQATMFFKDPSGNALEFKSFRDLKQLFAS